MSRPDEGLIHTWLDGELDAAEAARVEALVKSDPEWAAAAAEARGLIAASSRIVGALDDVPANVVPKAKPHGVASSATVVTARPVRRTMAPWMMRAAAAVVVIVGTTIVLTRTGDEGTQLSVAAPDAARESAPKDAAKAPEARSSKLTVNAPPAPTQTIGPSRQAPRLAKPDGEGLRADDAKRANALADAAGKPAAEQDKVSSDPIGELKKETSKLKTSVAASGATAAPAAPASAMTAGAVVGNAAPLGGGGAGVSMNARDAGATGNRVLPQTKALLSEVVTTSAGDERRASATSATPREECYREPGVAGAEGLLHRVTRTTDSTAVAATSPNDVSTRNEFTARARLAVNTYRIRGDTLFAVVGTNVLRTAFKVACPVR